MLQGLMMTLDCIHDMFISDQERYNAATFAHDRNPRLGRRYDRPSTRSGVAAVLTLASLQRASP